MPVIAVGGCECPNHRCTAKPLVDHRRKLYVSVIVEIHKSRIGNLPVCRECQNGQRKRNENTELIEWGVRSRDGALSDFGTIFTTHFEGQAPCVEQYSDLG